MIALSGPFVRFLSSIAIMAACVVIAGLAFKLVWSGRLSAIGIRSTGDMLGGAVLLSLVTFGLAWTIQLVLTRLGLPENGTLGSVEAAVGGVIVGIGIPIMGIWLVQSLKSIVGPGDSAATSSIALVVPLKSILPYVVLYFGLPMTFGAIAIVALHWLLGRNAL